MTARQYPTRQARRSTPLDPADAVVILGFLALIWALAQVRSGIVAPPPATIDTTSFLDPINLPYYALRSIIRMFAGLALSILFTFAYGYAAAKSRRAARVLIPLLDVLQSVPVLGFLSFIVPSLVALSPHSTLGLELASIFAVFTAQAWNMTFSFYHSLITIPGDLKEATRLYHVPLWQRFVRLEVPSSMIGLIWNGMMSFGGAWFFLAASEAIAVNNQTYTLPGIGSYVQVANQRGASQDLILALLTMVILIVLVDQLFWRPLVAWAERFKVEESESKDVARSWFLNVLKRSHVLTLISAVFAPFGEWAGNRVSQWFKVREHVVVDLRRRTRNDRIFNIVLIVGLIAAAVYLVYFLYTGSITLLDVGHVLLLGLITLARVLLLIVVAAIIWTPVGVYIGLHPRLSQYAQPIVQILASFPANFLFPIAIAFFHSANITIEIGCIVLMALGTQWYILFNSIAGAIALPNDMKEMAANLGLRGWRLWRDVLLPGIFPAWVTGAITASGGAWNASIVAEIVTAGGVTLTATGLGTYIAQASNSGNSAQLVLGISIMSLYVVGINRLFWARLYHLAETRYRIGQ